MRKIDWDSQIGRRLKLRDLQVFSAVMQNGSMAKAAARLGVSQPAVSEVISNLEYTLGVQLLDRNPQGVKPTIYGRALFKHSLAALDELRQGIRDIEFLVDPPAGEVRIGCAESIATTLLPRIIQPFSQQHPRIILRVEQLVTPTLELLKLRERGLDTVLARLAPPGDSEIDDLNVDTLFDDHSVLATGTQSPWARCRSVELAELVNEAWILPPADSWNYMIVAEAFRLRGLDLPKARLTTYSVYLRAQLVGTGPYITALPNSLVRSNRFPLKKLPVALPYRPWPLAVITLKNRVLSSAAQLFVEHVRAFADRNEPQLAPPRPAQERNTISG
jgi:DNA-binding transcriptional LysR family regulator